MLDTVMECLNRLASTRFGGAEETPPQPYIYTRQEPAAGYHCCEGCGARASDCRTLPNREEHDGIKSQACVSVWRV